MKRHVKFWILSLALIAAAGCSSDEGGAGGGGGNANGDTGDDLRPVGPGADADGGGGDDEANVDAPIFTGETCDNEVDDDSDTLVDCDDPDCSFVPECDEGGNDVEIDCDNGADDDGDNRVDCNDSDCATDPACDVTPGTEICTNEADDDGDTLIDCFDADCAMDDACRPSTAENCTNGVDDDADDAVDCDDADCVNFCEGGGGTGTDDPFCLIFCLLDPVGAEELLGCVCS